jgi:hypothetical protein
MHRVSEERSLGAPRRENPGYAYAKYFHEMNGREYVENMGGNTVTGSKQAKVKSAAELMM